MTEQSRNSRRNGWGRLRMGRVRLAGASLHRREIEGQRAVEQVRPFAKWYPDYQPVGQVAVLVNLVPLFQSVWCCRSCTLASASA